MEKVTTSTTKDYCLLGCYTILPGRKLAESYKKLPPPQKNKLHERLWPLKKCLPEERR
jgi:hypothetical protein